MIGDVGRLVEIESPSLDIAALSQSARELALMMEQRLGSSATLIDSVAGPHVHWVGGGTPKVLIVGHHDTVFPKGALAARPFTVEGDKATGPGIFDMKAGIVQAIHGVAALADKSGVEILITSDEEVGSVHSRDLIVERAKACGAVLVLEPSADGGALKTARKGTGTFELHVLGRASHAGLEPEKGVNSTIEIAHAILAISELENKEFGTTVVPTLLRSGNTTNTVPDLAVLDVDIRSFTTEELLRIDTAIHSLQPVNPATRYEITGGFNRPPLEISSTMALYERAEKVAKKLGMPPLGHASVGGASDGNFAAAAGAQVLDGLGAIGDGAHAAHEWVDITTLEERSVLLHELIKDILND